MHAASWVTYAQTYWNEKTSLLPPQGAAIRPGTVFHRLTDPALFTGVYRRAWETDGRINQYSEVGASSRPSAYVGNTNTGTDELISDIRYTLRPNLAVGKTFR